MRTTQDRSYPKRNMKDFKITHEGSLYGVKLWMDMTQDPPLTAGQNWFYEKALPIVVWMHNWFVEPPTQMFAYWFDRDYEPGFPIWLWEVEEGEEWNTTE